jgi:hypothetical protein
MAKKTRSKILIICALAAITSIFIVVNPGLRPAAMNDRLDEVAGDVNFGQSEVTGTPTEIVSTPPPGLNMITLIDTTNIRYSPRVPDFTLFDATQWKSTAVGPGRAGTSRMAANIYGQSSAAGGNRITWRGGIITGSIPSTWDWATTHSFGGGGIYIHNNGPVEWQYVRIHNVEDGIKLRETPEYSNTGSWVLRDSYFTAIRDDAVEDDRFEPGTVQDCLFDGVHVFISEQDEGVGINTPIGPNEDNTIYIQRNYVRLYGTNGGDGPGRWFKWLGNVPHHKLVISDSVFAIGSVPRLGWENQKIPAEVSWVGTNYILWLGTPGSYGGPKPQGVIFLEGQAASDKWIAVRNKWLSDHNLPEQNFPADYNPYDAPLIQIPVISPSLAQ